MHSYSAGRIQQRAEEGSRKAECGKLVAWSCARQREQRKELPQRLHKAIPDGAAYGFRVAGNMQFFVNVADVTSHGVVADLQVVRDHFVATAFHEQCQNIFFAVAKARIILKNYKLITTFNMELAKKLTKLMCFQQINSDK